MSIDHVFWSANREGMTHGHRLAFHRSRVLQWLMGIRSVPQQSSSGGLAMDGITWIALVLTVGLIVYLTAALLKPENFS
jgi:K+-transporting ATPase KdpF subunit